MQPESPKTAVFQSVRKADNQIVTWYRRDGVDHLLPAVANEFGVETPLDMRVQWNETDFYAMALREGFTPKTGDRVYIDFEAYKSFLRVNDLKVIALDVTKPVFATGGPAFVYDGELRLDCYWQHYSEYKTGANIRTRFILKVCTEGGEAE